MTSTTIARAQPDGTVIVPAPVDLGAVVRFPAPPDAESPRALLAAARNGGFGALVVSARGQALDDDGRANALRAELLDAQAGDFAATMGGDGGATLRLVIAMSLTRGNKGEELADLSSSMAPRNDGPRVF